jgi:enoyl-[acyl-carrier-protein] reductase (NADH)
MADASLRSRERTLAIEAARHKLLVTEAPAKPVETVAVNKGVKKGRQAVHDALRCKALTLEGRRCGFKATCGEFCKKHSVEKI